MQGRLYAAPGCLPTTLFSVLSGFFLCVLCVNSSSLLFARRLLFSLTFAPEKQMCKRHQDHRTHGCCGQRKQECVVVHDSQLCENPSADHRADQSEKHVSNASDSATTGNFPRQPARN